MRIQSQVIFYVLCVNVAVIIVLHLSVPGVEYASGLSAGVGSIADIQSRFNATDIAGRFGNGNIFTGFLDALMGTIGLISNYVTYFLFGFIMVMQWFGPVCIQDSAGILAYNFLTDVFAVVFGFLIVVWLIEFASGRTLFD